MSEVARKTRGTDRGGSAQPASIHTRRIPVAVGMATAPVAKAVAQAATRTSRDHKPAWSNRFDQPSRETLLCELPSQSRKQFELARELLLANSAAYEQVEWLGAWNWAIAIKLQRKCAIAYAYLIPDPARPRICIPTHEDSLRQKSARVRRVLIDALRLAPVVDNVRWATWGVHSREQVEAITAFAAEFSHAHAAD